MHKKYVPILRWKLGEKICLENLTENTAEQIIPFIEIAPISSSSNEDATDKKVCKFFSSFEATWKDKPFYLYLTEDWYAGVDSPQQIAEIYENFFNSVNHPYAIPAFDITDEINISNAKNLTENNGLCLRIDVNNFETLGKILDYYISNSWINPQDTDLLLDLKYIDSEIYPKKAALTTVLSDITNVSAYRRVIIASCSFPKDVSNLQSNVVNECIRHEATIHDISLKLKKTFSFNYVYGDYGPMNLNEVAFVIGMIPNFKIKYSSSDKYLIVKGISLKKGGLDLVNVATCCRQLMNHPQYSGANFSFGDKAISDIANGIQTKTGNLTNWVGYTFNHHITLIVSII